MRFLFVRKRHSVTKAEKPHTNPVTEPAIFLGFFHSRFLTSVVFHTTHTCTHTLTQYSNAIYLGSVCPV